MTNLTLEDIAKKAGVSRSTVSRVINQQPNVKKDVRERVRRVIESTGFRPHPAARALASQHSSTIGLVLPQSVSFFFTDPYYSHLTKGIAQACNQHDYTLALFLVESEDDEKKIFASVTRKGFLDGVLVQSGHHGEQQVIGDLVDANIPQVVIGRPFRSDNVSYLDIDNINAAFNAVTHLIRIGHKRIGTITGPLHSTVGLDRKTGYVNALRERGLHSDESLIVEGDFTENGGYYAMKKLLPSKPDAVFAASDVMAIGAMRAAREAGLRIPDDIAFVGFDDLPIATLSDVQLTTIRQPVAQFGAKAVEILIDLIENGIKPPQHIILGTELVIRDSCGAGRK
ncbi:MAG TPA: LacI family DNA-binding transcriptional regulator [Anaerolineales bacterium]|nr:LacI family DNA-binding transcriptional regulator [Anaerolineales bacterium]